MCEDDWEQMLWQDAFWSAMEQVEYSTRAYQARFCPICKKDCGEADFTPDDPSTGIFGVCWGNECPVHGIFSTDSDGVQELEESS